MIMELTHKTITGSKADLKISLAWEKRIKSRLRVQLDDGSEAGIFLERGTVLRGGDVLTGATGDCVEVVAALETVSTVRPEDPLLFGRLCYHLGNRHIALEILPGRIRYLHDHVLDEMVVQLGGTVTVENAPFEPEHGAYGSSQPAHSTHSHG